MDDTNIKSTLIRELNPIYHVLVIENGNSRQTIVLEEGNYSIGRDPRNTLVIPSKKVSRFHATLLRRTDVRKKSFSYWILDGDLQGNRSTNGIYINEKRSLVQELHHEDSIQLGFEVQAHYYIVNNLSDLNLLRSGDFDGQQTKSNQNIDNKTKIYEGLPPFLQDKIDKETVVISEAHVEDEDSTNLMVETPPELTKLASFPELSPNPIIEIDWDGNVTYVNPAASNKFPDLLESPLSHPLILGLINKGKHYDTDKLFVREVQIKGLKGQVFEQYIHYLSGRKLIRSYIFDFTKRKQIEEQLKESEKRYKAVINQTQEGIFLLDADNYKILEVNNAFADLLGYSLDEIYSLKFSEMIDLDQKTLDGEITNLIKNDSKINKKLSFYHKNKSSVILDNTISVINYGDQKILCFSVRQEKKVEEKVTIVQEPSTLHDLMTGLPNRDLFMEQLNTAIANNRRKQALLCVFFLEVDKTQDFKKTMTFGVQSQLVEGFAKRLRSSLRLGDTVARWENNEFIVLLPQVRSVKDIGKIATRILEVLKPSFFIEKQNIYLKTNMGIAIYDQETENVETLLDNAKEALIKSKEKPRNNYQFYDQKIQKDIDRLLRLEKLLIYALEKEEFLLYYQPQVNIKTKKITGLETLLRWQHPELGKIGPGQFLSLAEETGLIIPIGEWILEKTCQQNKIWQQKGIDAIPVSVNISAQQFKQSNLIPLIRSIIQETGLNPDCLELEVKEQIIIDDLEFAKNTINELKDIGVRICLDDFGAGISGIGYLKNFKIDTLKIDRSMIKNIETDNHDFAIISALINLGKSFNLRVIAEGVETKKQMDLLSELGCLEIQGNLFTEALSIGDITNFLAKPTYNI